MITDHGAAAVRDIGQQDHPAVHVEELSRESVPGKVIDSATPGSYVEVEIPFDAS